jgi:hypothetical protein
MIKRINKLTVRARGGEKFFLSTLSLTPVLGALSKNESGCCHQHGRLMKKFLYRARGISVKSNFKESGKHPQKFLHFCLSKLFKMRFGSSVPISEPLETSKFRQPLCAAATCLAQRDTFWQKVRFRLEVCHRVSFNVKFPSKAKR